jgi:Ca2+-binding RTX toxin-like protein
MNIEPSEILGEEEATRPVFEDVEQRTHMSVAELDDHELTVIADEGNDRIELDLNDDASELTVHVNGDVAGTFAANTVYVINLNAGNGNNRIALDPRIGATTGLITGSGRDTIYGGSGNDYISSGGGRDVIDGRAGNDTIHGAAGDDTLIGSVGDDTLNGNAGNDGVQPGAGSDNANGGTGGETNFGDIIRYNDATSYVLVQFFGPPGQEQFYVDGAAYGDNLAGFESIYGSAYADHLTAHVEGVASLVTGNNGDDHLATDDGDGLDAIMGGNHDNGDDCYRTPGDVVVTCRP